MKVYLHIYSGNVQQNPLCVESSFTIHLPRLSPTMFDPDAKSVLLLAHLCTAADSMRRKPWVRNCSRERKALYNGNVHQNPLCAASCFTKDVPSLPVSRLRVFITGQIQHRTVHRLLTECKMKEVPNIDLRREDTKKSRNGILIGQCAQFLIHPSPN